MCLEARYRHPELGNWLFINVNEFVIEWTEKWYDWIIQIRLHSVCLTSNNCDGSHISDRTQY